MMMKVWKRATCNMSRGLNMGGNAITQALVEGNVEALQDAISSVPRSKRAEWLCQVMTMEICYLVVVMRREDAAR